MTSALKKSSKRKQKLYNKYLKSRSVKDEYNYKSYKKLFYKLIKRSKIDYCSNQLNSYKTDIKKTWSILNEITGRKKIKTDNLPKSIKVKNKIIYDKNKMCTEFNKFFVNVGPSLASKIKLSKKSKMRPDIM